jgi:hypothetical protein
MDLLRQCRTKTIRNPLPFRLVELAQQGLGVRPGRFPRKLPVRGSQIGKDFCQADVKFVVIEGVQDFFWKRRCFANKGTVGNGWRYTGEGRRQ